MVEGILNSGTHIFLHALFATVLVHARTTMVRKCAPRDTFFKNHQPNRVLK